MPWIVEVPVKIALVVTLMTLGGCVSTAGPFIRNLSVNQDGVLIAERCQVTYDHFTKQISVGLCGYAPVDLSRLAEHRPRPSTTAPKAPVSEPEVAPLVEDSEAPTAP
jgi:hypothetical protein